MTDIAYPLWDDRWARAAIAAELAAPSTFKAWRLGWWATRLPAEQRRIVLDWAIDAFEALIPTRIGPGNDAGPFCAMAPYLSAEQRARAVDIAQRMRAAGWRDEIDAALEALQQPSSLPPVEDVEARRRAMLGPLDLHINRRIDDYLRAGEPFDQIVREQRFLPLYNGWTAILGVRPDGVFVRWNCEGQPQTFELLPDPYWQRLAACHGARRYLEIAELVAMRPPDATTCRHCQGIGVIPQLPAIGCYCAGSGWLLPNEPSPGKIG
jgi:hypothetical protein